MSTWLVDGMNVIGSRPDGWWRDRGAAMRRLAAALSEWAVREGHEVTLVLDGRERDLGSHAGVEARFAAVADDLIAELADERRPDVVVTSDRGLAARLDGLGVRVEGASALLGRLDY